MSDMGPGLPDQQPRSQPRGGVNAALSQPQISATKRSRPLAGYAADALGAVDSFARQPFGYDNPPVALASDFLGVPAVQRTLDRISYGEPLTTGKGWTTKPRNETTEAAFATLPAAAKAMKMLTSAAQILASSQYATRTYSRVSAKIRGVETPPERLFSHDYPNWTAQDSSPGSRLAVDMDGRPLTARYVAGRSVVGGPEERLRPEAISDIARSIADLQVVPRLPGRDVGRYTRSGDQRTIQLHEGLGAHEASRVLGHELGHAIDDIAGPYTLGARGGAIPTTGVAKDLARVYDDLNNRFGAPLLDAPRMPKKQHTPAIDGYSSPVEQDAERMAEALRLYMENPAYIKTAAPRLAARLREYVNVSPNLKNLVQLNSLSPVAVGVGALGGAGLQEAGE